MLIDRTAMITFPNPRASFKRAPTVPHRGARLLEKSVGAPARDALAQPLDDADRGHGPLVHLSQGGLHRRAPVRPEPLHDVLELNQATFPLS